MTTINNEEKWIGTNEAAFRVLWTLRNQRGFEV